MAPSAQVITTSTTSTTNDLVTKIIKETKNDSGANYQGGFADSLIELLPDPARKRLEKSHVDLSKGYPERPPTETIPIFVDDAIKFRDTPYEFEDRGKFADPEKKALFGAATEVKNLTKHIGTEIVGLQLSDLNDKQKDELALLVAERVVVFFRDQDLSLQKQLELGDYWGNVEVHPQQLHVPGLPGITVIWPDFYKTKFAGFRKFATNGDNGWHTDLVHELQPPGITHLHNDTIPSVGGDTVWSSGYAAYDKLSPAFQKLLDGKTAIYRSAHEYIDRANPLKGRKHIEREHPIIRTHPVTGWKALFVNRKFTTRIIGLEPEESKVVLAYLFDVLEKNLDIQVRFTWQPTKAGYGTSAIWDNRISQHYAVFDYEGDEPRHGTRVSSLAEVPYFDANSKSQREALGLSLD